MGALWHIDYKLKFQTKKLLLSHVTLISLVDWNAALILILNGTKKEHLGMLIKEL